MMYTPLALALALRVLTLEQAIETARTNHPDLRIASAQIDAARARVDGARAPLRPQLSGSARYSVSSGNEREAGFFSFDIGHSYSTGLSGSLLLYDFGRTTDRWRIAKTSVVSQTHAREATGQDVVLAVQLAYFEARAQKELVAVARETLENERRHLEQVGAFVEIGSRPEIELARVRTAVANAEAQVIRSENSYAVAKARLNRAIGVTADTNYDVSDQALEAIPGEDSTTAALVAEAIDRRPEFAELAAEISAQKLSLEETRKGLYPSLRLSADASYSGTRFDDPGWGAGTGVSLSWPLFDGYANRSAIKEEEISMIVLYVQKESLRQRVWLEVDEARLSVHSARAASHAANQALESARELLGLAEGRYEAGVGNIIELGDAQVAVTSAAAQAVQTEYDLAAARARLARALGK